MINKKAQGMSTNTIILLILGLVLLVALIVGFSSGWTAFKDATGKTNVDQVVQECSTTCSINEKYTFCNVDKEIRLQEEDLKYKTSCGVLSSVPEFKKLGVAECPKIECSVPCASIRINDLTGEKFSEVKAGYHDVSSFANDVDSGEFCLIAESQ